MALLYSFHCSVVSCGFYWLGFVYRWLLQLGPGAKTIQRHHPPYSFTVVQNIVHHCISHRSNSHMIRAAGIAWWRILMTMAHTNLVYIICFRNPRIWQKVNIVSIVFVNLTLSRSFLPPFSRNLVLCGPCNLHLSKWLFSTSSLVQLYKQYWQRYFLLLLLLYCDGFVLEIYLHHKFQWPQEGLNCESLAYKVVT